TSTASRHSARWAAARWSRRCGTSRGRSVTTPPTAAPPSTTTPKPSSAAKRSRSTTHSCRWSSTRSSSWMSGRSTPSSSNGPSRPACTSGPARSTSSPATSTPSRASGPWGSSTGSPARPSTPSTPGSSTPTPTPSSTSTPRATSSPCRRLTPPTASTSAPTGTTSPRSRSAPTSTTSSPRSEPSTTSPSVAAATGAAPAPATSDSPSSHQPRSTPVSELTTYQQPAPIADYQSRAIDRLGAWAQSADAAFAVAQRLVQSSFVPQQFRGKPVEATAAILAGAEVGLNPMASLRAFDVIQGQAAPRALTLRAVAQSHGHDIEVVESTTTRCRVRARRRGGDWQSITWTIDRAKELGLTGKDNWRKQPQAMLVARATAEAARLVAADAILGIGYSAEEVADGADGDVVLDVGTDAEASPGKRVMSRGRKPAREPEPEQEPQLAPEPVDPDAWDTIPDEHP